MSGRAETSPSGRTETSFHSGGTRCAAWWYPPALPAPAPALVMGHGFGATRTARLDAYAKRFSDDLGVGVLAFDYRHFGDSEGEPRQLLDIGSQLRDWEAAVAFARGRDGVDPERVGLWGTSFAGGHVLAVAAGDPRVAAVVSRTWTGSRPRSPPALARARG